MKRFLSILFCVLGILTLCSVVLNIGASGRSFHVHKEQFIFDLAVSAVFFIISYVLKNKSESGYPVAITSDNYKDFVVLTPGALELAKRKIEESKYPRDTALRIVKQEGSPVPLEVKFDVLSNDDRDWVGESSGIFVMVEKHIAFRVERFTIDAENGKFVISVQNQPI